MRDLTEKVKAIKAEDFDAITQGALKEADGYPVPHIMTADDVHTVLSKLV